MSVLNEMAKELQQKTTADIEANVRRIFGEVGIQPSDPHSMEAIGEAIDQVEIVNKVAAEQLRQLVDQWEQSFNKNHN